MIALRELLASPATPARGVASPGAPREEKEHKKVERTREKGMKQVLIILALLALLLMPVASAWDIDATRLAYSQRWDQGVVIVLNHRDRLYGTGWFIHPRYIVTAYHVIKSPDNLAIEIVKGTFHTNARVIAYDRDTDIAILELDKPYTHAHIFPLRPDIKKGETIYVLGFPYQLATLEGYNWEQLSMNPRAAKGTASWTNKLLIELGTYTDAGNSGGPIVDDNGNAVGLVTFAYPGEAATMYFATEAKEVIKLAKAAGIPFTPAGEDMGAVDDIVMEATGVDAKLKYMMLGAGAVAIAAIVIPLALMRRR